MLVFLFCFDKQDEQKQERNLSSRYGSVSLKVCLHNVECAHKFTQSLSPQCGMFPQIHIKFVSTIWKAPTNSHKMCLHSTVCSHKVSATMTVLTTVGLNNTEYSCEACPQNTEF